MELEALPQDTNISSQATGFIKISDVDPSGKFVQIKNMSTQVRLLKNMSNQVRLLVVILSPIEYSCTKF